MGGEKSATSVSVCHPVGSPPHGRGKVIEDHAVVWERGITPAWAGKSWQTLIDSRRVRDHPRMGGEKHIANFNDETGKGSPPHGRGKDNPFPKNDIPAGITPAWAGKSTPREEKQAGNKDHPRMGGEKSFCCVVHTKLRGSPPHGRGKGGPGVNIAGKTRITPAWAGKRLKRSHRSGIFISGPIPFHSVLHRPAGSGGSRAGRDGSPAGQPQNAGPA